MKVTALLPLALAYTATAELQLYSFPAAPAKRDLTTVTSVISEISDAITQLDTSVKSFTAGADTTPLQQDAQTLIDTLKTGAEKVAASTSELTLVDVAGLQDAASSLATLSGSLLTDLTAKKDAFEAAGLCDSVKSTLQSVSAGVEGLVSNVIAQLPEDAQSAATQLAGGITTTLTSEIAGFDCSSSSSSSNGDGSEDVADTYPTSSSAAAVTETCTDGEDLTTSSTAEAVTAITTSSAQCVAVTVTVTQDCACGTTTSTSSISIPVLTPNTSIPFPTGSNSTATLVPTGGVTTTATTSIPTAAAAANGVGAVGLMAGLAAALFV